VPGDLARRAAGDLGSLEPVADVIRTIDRCERFFMLDGMMMMSRGGPKAAEWLGELRVCRIAGGAMDWNVPLRKANLLYDREVAACRQLTEPGADCRDESVYEDSDDMTSEISGKTSATKLILLRAGGWPCRKALSERVGDVILAFFMPTLSRAVVLQKEYRAGTDVERAAFALAAFHAETGRWPEGLAELTPKYLPAEPLDRFTGRPLVYRPRPGGYVLYSVGINGLDDGGRCREDAPDDDGEAYDIVASVGKPLAKQPATAPAGR